MQDPLIPTLLKVLLPVIGIAVVVFAARLKKLSLAEDIGLRVPVVAPAALFLILWLAWVAAAEWLDGTTPKPWRDNPVSIVALRILAIGVLGPIAEELAFRGLLLAVLRRTRLGLYGAIVVVAVLWSAAHVQYEVGVMVLLLIDGVVLGLARHFTKSIYVPIVMHMAGNLFSIWQSLQGSAP